MSTLNVNVGKLRAAVEPYRVVRNLSVSTSFPHGLRIHVVEQLPVAAVSVGGVHTAVAADGVVLGPTLPGLLASERVQLPAITLPAGTSALADLESVAHSPEGRVGHIGDATARAELSVLGAAPRVLLGWVSKVFIGSEGLTVAMRGGLSIYFGDATRPHAKWLSAARVLADPSSAGATYVDVRAPERPAAGTTAAGGLAGGDAPTGQAGTVDATSAALANVLAEAISGGSGTASATGSAAGATSAGSSAGSSAAASPAGVSGTSGSAAPASSSTEPSTTEPSTTEAGAANSGAATGDSESSTPEASSSTSG
jgi:hypothetical protein